MAKIFIVEGPDGSGKTTLAKRIEAEFEIPYTRYQGLSSTKGPDKGMPEWWRNQLVARGERVYDRCFYISEVIYQLAKERPLMVDAENMMRGIQAIWSREPFIIFCLPPWSTSREIIRSQSETLAGVTEQGFEKIHWAYASFYAMWAEMLDYDNVTSWDFTTQSDDGIMRWVDQRREKRGKR